VACRVAADALPAPMWQADALNALMAL
jgi:hypothetical protein